VWLRDGEERAVAWASAKWGSTVGNNLNEAIKVSGASGWGITAQEAGQKIVGDSVNWVNPLSSNSPLPYVSRKVGDWSEGTMRGTHAYSVLERGGSNAEALSRVEKFHFNYRDIGEFDQVAKKVIPFWTFFSRNAALQAEVWARNPGKLNRSYFNMKRNLEFISEDEESQGTSVPDYLIEDLGGIRTPWGGADRGRAYLTPDLPGLKFRKDAGDPLGALLGGVGPGLKVPYQMVSGTDQFTGRDYRDEFTQRTATGDVPRLGSPILQLPGVRNVADVVLPGTRLENGQLLQTDRGQMISDSVNPGLARISRLFPNMPRQQETRTQAIVSVFGGSIRWNDPGSQAGARAADRAERNQQATQLALDAKLRRLTE